MATNPVSATTTERLYLPADCWPDGRPNAEARDAMFHRKSSVLKVRFVPKSTICPVVT